MGLVWVAEKKRASQSWGDVKAAPTVSDKTPCRGFYQHRQGLIGYKLVRKSQVTLGYEKLTEHLEIVGCETDDPSRFYHLSQGLQRMMTSSH